MATRTDLTHCIRVATALALLAAMISSSQASRFGSRSGRVDQVICQSRSVAENPMRRQRGDGPHACRPDESRFVREGAGAGETVLWSARHIRPACHSPRSARAVPNRFGPVSSAQPASLLISLAGADVGHGLPDESRRAASIACRRGANTARVGNCRIGILKGWRDEKGTI